MADDKLFRADLVDVIVQTLTQGLMKNINKALAQYDYTGDEALNTEFDSNGNPTNFKEWDFRTMSSNRPRPDAPYLLVGRVVPWSDDDYGISPSRPADNSLRVKEDDALIVESQTTGGQEDGMLLVDGLTNFDRQGISINQYVAKYDADGNEEDNTFVSGILSPHKVWLQDPLFYDTNGGEGYKIFHTEVDRTFSESGTTMLRFAIHNSSTRKATISVHAIRHYFQTLQANDDLISVELDERESGENPAWAFVEEVGDIIDASRLLSEDEVNKGIQKRHEVQVTLRVAEALHRLDPALESNLQVKISNPQEGE
ncbi:MAG: hypothetical protein K9L56_13540 [Clostridiales bacterium]|nr:hypothetical protein [Clostridiales bacterium]